MASVLQKYVDAIAGVDTIKHMGRVVRVRGLLIESEGPPAQIGDLCQVERPDGRTVWAEVVGLDQDRVQLMPFADAGGIEIGTPVIGMGYPLSVPVSDKLLGRVLDSLGRPTDGRGEISSTTSYPAIASPPPVMERSPIRQQLYTGVRAIDALVPVGMGQRLGIFSASGVGKSTLLGMIARNTSADVNVVALIGERAREVREFLENDLGPEGLARSVVVVSTSDTPPLARLRGAFVATAIAEYFRDRGKNVMLLFDSVTRFARAQREIGLSIGEAPANRGFPPSVFALLPRLLERAGTAAQGSITGFYSVLVEGDDLDEPVSDTVRGILDGHLVLSRRLAERSHFPAIDVLGSISRLQNRVTSEDQRDAAGELRSLLAAYTEREDLISIGAYARGSDARVDRAIERIDGINTFLRQRISERSSPEDTIAGLKEAAGLSERGTGGGNSAEAALLAALARSGADDTGGEP